MPREVLPSFGPHYTPIKKLGHGSFGTVYQCLDKRTNESVAIKVMPRGRNITKYTEAEMVNHSRLAGHPHVINFKEVFVTEEELCLVMEFAVGGTLLQYINRVGRLDETVARRFFQQLILALDFCHKNGIAVSACL
jgi:serine/threonine-protein kinase SRK2